MASLVVKVNAAISSEDDVRPAVGIGGSADR